MRSSAHLTREGKSEIRRAKKKRNKENQKKCEAYSGVSSVSNAAVSNASCTITKGEAARLFREMGEMRVAIPHKESAKAPEEKPEEDSAPDFVEVLGERTDGDIQARQKKHKGKKK